MRPQSILCLAIGLLAAAQPAAGFAAEDLLVEVERRGDGVEVRARAVVSSPVALIWQVLTDYERLPRFIPGIAKSAVRERQGNRVLLEQSGEARLLLFSFPIEVTLEVIERPAQWISSRAVSGNVRRMIGRYELNADAGRPGVLLRYYGLIEPDFDLPQFIAAAALRIMAEEQFVAMVAEIERRAAAAPK